MKDRTGETLAATYRLVRQIGEGGMGAVYEAEHLRLPRRFAIKLLHAHTALEADVVQRFRREAEIASDLGSENIVEVVDFNVSEDGSPYIVMELLRGESLASLLHREGALPLDDVATILDQLASALHAAHQKGIVHRDLKPQNVQVERKPGGRLHVKVLDFGISKVLRATSVVTGTGTVVGTPQYMAPEQAQGRVDEIDARTDVFALGVMLYEMLAGKPPFAGDTLPAILYQVVHEPAPPLATVAPTVPSAVQAAVERALAKDRADRPGSMAELRDLFLRAAGHDPVALASHPETRIVRADAAASAPTAHHAPKMSRRGAFVAVSVLVLAGVAIVVAVGGSGRANPTTSAPRTSEPADATTAPATTAPHPETTAPATALAPETAAPSTATPRTTRPRAPGTKRRGPLWEKDL